MEFNQAFDPFRALQSAWKALSQAPLPLMVGGVLLLLTDGGCGGGARFQFGHHHGGWDWSEIRPFLFPLVGICACVGIALFLFSSWIKVGFANTVENVLRTGHGEVGQIFEGKGRFGSMVLARLLGGLVVLVGVVPFVALVIAVAILTRGFERHEGLALVLIPGFLVWFPAFLYVVLGISLADQAVALEGAHPVESLKRSWSLVSGHRLMLFLYLLVGGIFTALGFCLCCVGVFVTGSLVHVARSESYLALVRGGERSTWWIEKGAAQPAAPQGWGAPPAPPTLP